MSLPQLNIPLHVKYIQNLGAVSHCALDVHSILIDELLLQNKDDLMYHLTAHLRMNAIYWGLTALCVMKRKDALDREEMVDFVMSCWDDEAGPSSYPRFSHRRPLSHNQGLRRH